MKNKERIGKKVKWSLLVIWGHLSFLTWTILISNVRSVYQVLCLALTIVVAYLQIIIMQDYYYLKIEFEDRKTLRQDVRFVNKLKKELRKDDK